MINSAHHTAPWNAPRTHIFKSFAGLMPSASIAVKTAQPCFSQVSHKEPVNLSVATSPDSLTNDLERRWDTKHPPSVSMHVLQRPIETAARNGPSPNFGECRLFRGGFNGSAQHFNLFGKMEC